MNYMSILKCDTANSMTGFNVSLFVAGCARRCPGCFNPEAWDCSAGKPFDGQARGKVFAELAKPCCSGLSILGGEPMSRLSDNRAVITRLARDVKALHPAKTVYMWTGYTLEELEASPDTAEVLGYLDYLIDGPFVQELKTGGLVLRGSSNQRVWHMPDRKLLIG